MNMIINPVSYTHLDVYKRQEEEGIKNLTALKRSTDMLICAEDLGMVPEMVAGVLDNMHMLALEVQLSLIHI